jgi:hypothetical protein
MGRWSRSSVSPLLVVLGALSDSPCQRASLHLDKIPPLSDWIAELSQKLPEDGSLIKEKDDARWVNEFADELTVAIALREWEKAVTFVEQGLSSSECALTNRKLIPSALQGKIN